MKETENRQFSEPGTEEIINIEKKVVDNDQNLGKSEFELDEDYLVDNGYKKMFRRHLFNLLCRFVNHIF